MFVSRYSYYKLNMSLCVFMPGDHCISKLRLRSMEIYDSVSYTSILFVSYLTDPYKHIGDVIRVEIACVTRMREWFWAGEDHLISPLTDLGSNTESPGDGIWCISIFWIHSALHTWHSWSCITFVLSSTKYDVLRCLNMHDINRIMHDILHSRCQNMDQLQWSYHPHRHGVQIDMHYNDHRFAYMWWPTPSDPQWQWISR